MPQRPSPEELHQLHTLKKRAIVYFQHNGVPQQVELVLNQMFRDDPADVYGYLSSHFDSMAAPVKISGVVSYPDVDSRGCESLRFQMVCEQKNKTATGANIIYPMEIQAYDHAKIEEKEAAEDTRALDLYEAALLITDKIQPRLSKASIEAENQKEIDDILRSEIQNKERELKESINDEACNENEFEVKLASTSENANRKSAKGKKGGKEVVIIPDEPRESLVSGCEAFGAVSVCASIVGALSRRVNHFDHVNWLVQGDTSEKTCSLHIPLPMVTIFNGGKLNPGKLNAVKEFMIVPKPELSLSMREIIQHCVKVYNAISRGMTGKSGGPTARYPNDMGSLMPAIDKLEQGIDMLIEALTTLELQEKYDIALNFSSSEIFDYDKGKYEIMTGQLKTPDELADVIIDLSNKYPQIVAIFDPIRMEERLTWMKLAERITEHCHVIGDRSHHRPGRLMAEDFDPQFQTSGFTARLTGQNLITEIIDCSAKFREANKMVCFATGNHDSCDTYVVDIAVGLGADFVRFGSPCRGEHVAKYSRLAEIEDILISEDRLARRDCHKFEQLMSPPPAPENIEEEAVVAS